MSKQKKEIASLKAERDHWRNKAQAYKRLLERQQMWASILADGKSTIDKAMDQVQTERDEARQELARLKSIINSEFRNAVNTPDRIEPQLTSVAQDIEYTIEHSRPPHIVLLLLKVLDIAGQSTSDTFNEVIGPYHQQDISTNMQLAIQLIFRYGYIAGMQMNRLALASTAFAFANDPRVIADEIIRECRMYGQPTEKTLHYLSEDWMQDNLKPKPTFPKLREALGIAHAYITSDLPANEFAQDHNISPRTLRAYQAWYKTLKDAALDKPKELWAKTKLEAIEDEVQSEGM